MKSQIDDSPDNIKQNKYLKMMSQNCLRLLRLINNFIDITKIDSNYFNITLQNYNIIKLVKDITTSVIEYGKNKGITILFDTNVEQKIIACDPDQIERIILNLLSNAIKFTPTGGYIWVSTLDMGNKINIIVKDTGIGIPQDKQKNIFNRFKQVDSILTRRHEGSGIGLSIVKALVNKHGGNITVNSDIGKGSEFIIEIPCRIMPEVDNKSNFNYSSDNRNHTEKIKIEFSDIYS